MAEPEPTMGICSTSSTPPKDKLVFPKTKPVDEMDKCSHTSLDLFRDAPKKMKNVLYNVLPKGVVVDVSNDDDKDKGILGQYAMDLEANKKVKEESFLVAELNKKFKLKMKEKMAEVKTENARRMAVLQEELWESNAKMTVIFEILTLLT